jgi:hypothetical protein
VPPAAADDPGSAGEEDEEFSLASARRAADEGRLADWVAAFLTSPGSDNEALAGALAFDGAIYTGPVRFELDRLQPLAGPDEDEVVVPIDEDEWEGDIATMVGSLEAGWEPPPLLVSHRDGRFLLEDGNHRHETLRRAGSSHAWAVLVFSSVADRDQFLATAGDVADL